jgi:PAS domain S-box-containing protein
MPLTRANLGSSLLPRAANPRWFAKPDQFRLQGATLLATAAASLRQRRLALAVVVVSAAAFLLAVRLAQVPLAPLPAFIPAYEAALVIIDLITALLLFGQFNQTRSAALLALAAGYLYDGLMVVPHALTFPDVMSPTGWLGAGMHTTAWLYMFWHGGFPIFVLAYAGLDRLAARRRLPPVGRWHPLWVIAATIGLAVALTLLATKGDHLLPPIMAGNTDTWAQKRIAFIVWGLTAGALAALLLDRPYSVLRLWLIVVMAAWLADIALSAIFDSARFDLGFYVGRAYGLLAASFVLAVILIETSGLYSELATAGARLAEHARELDERVRQRTAELGRANRQLNAIIEAAPLSIFMLDPAGNVVLWTVSAERLFGYTAEEAVGRPPPYLSDSEIAVWREAFARTVAEASSGFNATQRQCRDGTMIDVSVTWAPVHDEDGTLLGVMYAIADVTERRKLESQLQQAQKMEAIGQLTGGLAHDFNNHLGAIILNLDVLRERIGGDAESVELTDEALGAAMRGAELIRRLLAFARRQPLQPVRTEINSLIAEITKLLARTLGEAITIALELDETIWPTVVDPAQLEASLTNLATNARDAMPNGGRLTIATGNRNLDADYAEQHAEVTPGDYAMIEVSDSGAGIPPELLSHVFEPFFTTKAVGRGTGLGLSMVYGFIKQSGGHINVYSEVGVGTTIRLYLPHADADAPHSEEPAPQVVSRGRGETVLAVEDNPGLRRVVVRQLSEVGYRVLEAEDARAALTILESEPVAVLFTDVVLPGGVSGYDLVSTALARWPAIKIVLTSGFPERQIADEGRLQNVELLSKPYRREDIARTISKVLA